MSISVLENRSLDFLAVFKFFASLKLAIVVLIALMAILAAGTIIESLHGTDAARIVVYESWWFSALLVLLGVNVAAAALDRLPWKKKHIGFVITHAGIIVILAGSLVTQKTMIDGQIVLAEGETDHNITLPEPILYLFSEKEHRDWILTLPQRGFPWEGRKKIFQHPFSIYLTAAYPKARMEETIEAAEAGPPALEATIHNSFMTQTQWLLQNDPVRGEIAMGPATLKFTDERLKEAGAPAPESAYLEFEWENEKVIQIPIPSDLKLPATLSLEGVPYQIKLLRVFKNAMVAGKELVDQEKGEANPAVQLILDSIGATHAPPLQEKHTVFAKYPDFPTMHGMKPSAAGMRIFYRLPNGGSRGERHELRFVTTPSPLPSPPRGRGEGEGEVVYQIRDGLEIKSGIVTLGQDVPTGWMDIAFRVNQFFTNSKIERKFFPEPNLSKSEEAQPAIQLEIERDPLTLPSPRRGEGKGEGRAGVKRIWLRQGISESFELAGDRYQILYGQKRIPAGFRLKLKDFRLENYPGTNRPASFESDVTLKDDTRGVVRDVTISMNQPLEYRGFHIYQSGYSLPKDAGDSEISIFAVGRDPGVPLKYLGAIVMVGGIITMFYTRKFSSNAGRIG